jgi:predicted  nucleic acid-binding Zn-ribbon protein
MPGIMQLLQELHGHLVDLEDVKQQIDRGPLQIKGSQAQVDKKKAAIDVLKDQLRAMRKESDAKELSLKGGEARNLDLRGKLNGTTNAKEFEALKHEIARIEQANGVLEDEALGLISLQEDKSKEIAAAEKALADAKAEHAKLKELIDYKMQKFRERITILEAKIAELEGQLEPTPREDYRRLVSGRGSKGLAACDGDTCTACYSTQPPQIVQTLRGGKYVICTTCSALLYLPVSPS